MCQEQGTRGTLLVKQEERLESLQNPRLLTLLYDCLSQLLIALPLVVRTISNDFRVLSRFLETSEEAGLNCLTTTRSSGTKSALLKRVCSKTVRYFVGYISEFVAYSWSI